ncbi:MAG: hypothetical protein QGH45_24890, partial [Myxococcota bacterium]|nr:hypothetical protein [Myxococcota bacterium]
MSGRRTLRLLAIVAGIAGVLIGGILLARRASGPPPTAGPLPASGGPRAVSMGRIHPMFALVPGDIAAGFDAEEVDAAVDGRRVTI